MNRRVAHLVDRACRRDERRDACAARARRDACHARDDLREARMT